MINIVAPSPIYVDTNCCAICTSDEAGDEENALGELLRIECEKDDSNRNCDGTYVHQNCLNDWISSNGYQLKCLCCHTGNLIIDQRYISQELLARALFLQYVANYNSVFERRYNSNNSTRRTTQVYSFMAMLVVILIFLFHGMN